MKLVKYPLLILAMAALWACGGSGQTDESAQAADTTAQVAPIPADKPLPADPLPAQVEGELKKRLTDAQRGYLDQLRTAYRNASTAQQMADVYQMADSVRKMYQATGATDAEPQQAEQEWAWLEQAVPFMRVRQACSECPALPELNLLALSAKSQQTPETSDDLFFEALKAAHQPSYQSDDLLTFLPDGPRLATSALADCDICGYSRLGDGTITAILQRIGQAKATPLFAKWLDLLADEVVPNEFLSHFGGTKASALQELDGILQASPLTPAQRQRLEALKANLNTKKDLQFGCKTPGKCQY
jgi:hypothetical protein